MINVSWGWKSSAPISSSPWPTVFTYKHLSSLCPTNRSSMWQSSKLVGCKPSGIRRHEAGITLNHQVQAAGEGVRSLRGFQRKFPSRSCRYSEFHLHLTVFWAHTTLGVLVIADSEGQVMLKERLFPLAITSLPGKFCMWTLIPCQRQLHSLQFLSVFLVGK